MDIAFTQASPKAIYILYGNGTTNSFLTTTYIPLAYEPYGLTASDLNGDGKLDLVTANYTDNSISIFTNNGTTGFNQPYKMTANLPKSIYCIDINNDGKTDIVTLANGTDKTSIHLGSLSFNTTHKSVTCYGGNDGTATVSVTCGTSPYTYQWSTTPAQTTAIATGLSAGIYTVTITDAGKKSLSTTFLITQPDSIKIALSQINVDCHGGSNGSATVTISGGNPQYYFSNSIWKYQSQFQYKATNLKAGTYSSTVSDLKGCSTGLSLIIAEPLPISISTTILKESSCFFGSDGVVTAIVTGGTSPYSYDWSIWQPTNADTAYGFAPGDYTLSIHDSYNCVGDTDFTVSSPTMIQINTSVTDVSCFGGNDGKINALVTGGIPPYQYSWDSLTNYQTTATALNLKTNTYSLDVIDSLGCVMSHYGIVVNEPLPISSFGTVTKNTKCSGLCNGEILVTANGGISPYSFQWDSLANYQTSDVASTLCAGNYHVTITDFNGCTFTTQETVPLISYFDQEVYLTNLAAVDQFSVSTSFSSYYTYNLPTTIVPNSSNPRNYVDPGKKARFKVETTNQKINGQSIVSGICKVRSNSPYITITDTSSGLNNIGWGNHAWSADEFEIDIHPNTPSGTNAYIDFIVQENGLEYPTTCIAIPIRPLDYSPTTPLTIDDDNNPDSKGNDNDICEPGEIIEFYPWLNNKSTLDAEYVRGRFENLDNLGFITIWNDTPGVGTTVYDATWWNYAFAKPQTINSFSLETKPEYDFVFEYGNVAPVDSFRLYMVMAGGFNLFSSNALSLVQWTLPYTFSSKPSIPVGIVDEKPLAITLYPNPSKNYVIIENFEVEYTTYTFFNTLGEKVLYGNIKKGKNQISTEQLTKGIYFIQIGSENNSTKSMKLIKE